MSESIAVREPAWRRAAALVPMLLLIAGAAQAGPVRAETNSGQSIENVPVVSDAELRALRGGMTVMGVDFSFGAIQTVLVDGTPVARTVFTLADDGSLSRVLEILDPNLATAFSGGAVPGISLGSLANLEGVLVPGEDGVSLVLSGIRPGSIISALLNNAHDQNVAQHFDVQFAIHNFSDLQAQLSTIRAAHSLAGSLQLGALAGQ